CYCAEDAGSSVNTRAVRPYLARRSATDSVGGSLARWARTATMPCGGMVVLLAGSLPRAHLLRWRRRASGPSRAACECSSILLVLVDRGYGPNASRSPSA